MNFVFTVSVTVERREGKFAGREELAEQIREALDEANPGDLTGENEGQYEVSDWAVDEEPVEKAPRQRRRKSKPAAAAEGEVAP